MRTTTVSFGAMLLSLCVVSAAHAYIEGDGKGKAEADCFVGLEGYDDGDLSGFGKKGKPAIQCTDCDPSCDLDGVTEPNGSCTFSIAVRVNDAGDPICTPAALKKVAAKAKTKGTKLDFSTSFDAPLDGSSATSGFLDFPVLTKKFGTPKEKAGKGKVSMSAKKLEKPKLKDKDKFLFVCNPRPIEEACPASSTTTSSSSTTSTEPSTTSTTATTTTAPTLVLPIVLTTTTTAPTLVLPIVLTTTTTAPTLVLPIVLTTTTTAPTLVLPILLTTTSTLILPTGALPIVLTP